MKKFFTIACLASVAVALVLISNANAQMHRYQPVRVLGPETGPAVPGGQVSPPNYDTRYGRYGGMSGAGYSGTRGGYGGNMGYGSRGSMGYGSGFHGGMHGGQGGYRGGMGGGFGGHQGYGNHGGYYPILEEGQIQLTGTVTDVTADGFSILNGLIAVDAGQATVQYIPWFFSQEPVENVTVEPGERVSLLGEIMESESGILVSASTIRVMDAIHYGIDPMEGGISGIIDLVDWENNVLVLAGIPILVDENTWIRDMGTSMMWDSGTSLDAIQPGGWATLHVELVDTDGDGVEDSLWAERVMIHPSYETINP